MQEFKNNERTAQKKENKRNLICFRITFINQFYQKTNGQQK